MDIRSKFRTQAREPWEDASRYPNPHRWLLRASPRLGHLKGWRKGRRRARDPFGVNELGLRGAEKIPTALIACLTVLQTDTGR